MMTKTFDENEMYLWHNGELIYKKWLDTGQSAVFDLYGFVHRNQGLKGKTKKDIINLPDAFINQARS